MTKESESGTVPTSLARIRPASPAELPGELTGSGGIVVGNPAEAAGEFLLWIILNRVSSPTLHPTMVIDQEGTVTDGVLRSIPEPLLAETFIADYSSPAYSPAVNLADPRLFPVMGQHHPRRKDSPVYLALAKKHPLERDSLQPGLFPFPLGLVECYRNPREQDLFTRMMLVFREYNMHPDTETRGQLTLSDLYPTCIGRAWDPREEPRLNPDLDKIKSRIRDSSLRQWLERFLFWPEKVRSEAGYNLLEETRNSLRSTQAEELLHQPSDLGEYPNWPGKGLLLVNTGKGRLEEHVSDLVAAAYTDMYLNQVALPERDEKNPPLLVIIASREYYRQWQKRVAGENAACAPALICPLETQDAWQITLWENSPMTAVFHDGTFSPRTIGYMVEADMSQAEAVEDIAHGEGVIKLEAGLLRLDLRKAPDQRKRSKREAIEQTKPKKQPAATPETCRVIAPTPETYRVIVAHEYLLQAENAAAAVSQGNQIGQAQYEAGATKYPGLTGNPAGYSVEVINPQEKARRSNTDSSG